MYMVIRFPSPSLHSQSNIFVSSAKEKKRKKEEEERKKERKCVAQQRCKATENKRCCLATLQIREKKI